MPHPDARDADEVLGLLGNADHQDLELDHHPEHRYTTTTTTSPESFSPPDHLGITAGSPYNAADHQSSISTSPAPASAPAPPPTASALALRSASASPAPDATPSRAITSRTKPPALPRRQSSLAQPRPDGTPRTPNRVRFDEEAELIPLEEGGVRRSGEAADGYFGSGVPPNGGAARQHPYATRMPLGGDDSDDSGGDGEDSRWADEEDFMSNGAAGGRGRRGRGRGRRTGRRRGEQRLPLLTDIEAPSVTVANSEVGFSPEDLLESARPKSGLRSAFMNMANSIMYVSGLTPLFLSFSLALQHTFSGGADPFSVVLAFLFPHGD